MLVEDANSNSSSLMPALTRLPVSASLQNQAWSRWGKWHVITGKKPLRNIVEKWSSRLTTFSMHATYGVIQHDGNNITGIIRGSYTSKGNPIHTVGVAITPGIYLLRRSRLSRNLVALNCSLRTRTLLIARIVLNYCAKHITHCTGCFSRNNTHSGRLILVNNLPIRFRY